MDEFIDKNNSNLHIGDQIEGYKINEIIKLNTLQGFLYNLEHLETKAKHIHISRDDCENTFSIAFKTIPQDSTGAAHILEHTVLCGSSRYPVRDPFFTMAKRSLKTFMNAFTLPDGTVYPFSTQNEKDYYNLMDVYLDAVFFPKLNPLSFKQEGIRLEFEENDELIYKGIVYNEMKGVISSPKSLLYRMIKKFLYPDTPYTYNSGGDPDEIPSLTYEELYDFHKKYYHPSNSYFYTYGNLPLKKHLKYINENFLNAFKRKEPINSSLKQPRWNEPKKVSIPYPISSKEDSLNKYQVALAWLTADIRDTFEVLILNLLERILIGNSASPLYKGLIDSGLGSSLLEISGYYDDVYDTRFICGLKDVPHDSESKIESIIFDILTNLYRNGIEKVMCDSAIHQIEFELREVTNTPYPYGLNLLFKIISSWIHGGDLETVLNFDLNIDYLHKVASKKGFLEEKIKEYFLENNHRVLLTLFPDPELNFKENKRVKEELKKIKESLTEEDIKKIKEDAISLKKLQEEKEDISVLPTLELSDIPYSVSKVPSLEELSKDNITSYEQNCLGIFYLTISFGIGKIPTNLLPLVPFFCYVLTKIGSKKYSYTELAQLIDLYTGKVSFEGEVKTLYNSNNTPFPLVVLNAKCLNQNIPNLFEIIEEILANFTFNDLNRLKQLILDYKANFESSIIPNGHIFGMLLAERNFTKSNLLKEIWKGVHHLHYIKSLCDDLNNKNLEELANNLNEIAKILFNRNNLKIALIGDTDALSYAYKRAYQLKESILKEGNACFFAPEISPLDELPYEGWFTSSSVSFVVESFKLVTLEHADAPSLTVLGKLLKSLFLHREIREKGGAYSVISLYNADEGVFSIGSYRDPHIINTLRVYKEALHFASSHNFTKEEIKEGILQVASEIDKPDPPSVSAYKAFLRSLIGITDDFRLDFKKQILSLSPEDIQKVGTTYFNPERDNAIVVISDISQLESANKELKRELKLYKI